MTFSPPEDQSAPPPPVGVKFNADGQVIRHTGNTVIHHIAPGSIRDAMAAAQAQLVAADTGRCWGWLPVSSFHMTLFDGVSHAARHHVDHPLGLPDDVSAEACDVHVLDRLRDFDVGEKAPFKQRVSALTFHKSGGIYFELAAPPAEEVRLRGMRDRIAERIGLHRANHESYIFHITLAYLVRWPSKAELAAMEAAIATADAAFRKAVPEFPLGPPEVCLYDDMGEFRVQFSLEH